MFHNGSLKKFYGKEIGNFREGVNMEKEVCIEGTIDLLSSPARNVAIQRENIFFLLRPHPFIFKYLGAMGRMASSMNEKTCSFLL